MVGYRSAVYNIADDIRVRNFLHGHLDQAVVNQNRGSRTDIMDQFFISNGCYFIRTHYFLCCECKLLSCFQHYLSAFKITQTDFRSLCIQKRSDGKIQFLAHLAHSIIFTMLLFMISMGKIKTGYVHSCQHEFSQLFLTLGCGSDRTDNFGFSHINSFRCLHTCHLSIDICKSPVNPLLSPAFSTPCTFSLCLTYISINLMTSSVITSPGITRGIPGG